MKAKCNAGCSVAFVAIEEIAMKIYACLWLNYRNHISNSLFKVVFMQIFEALVM